MDAVTVTVPACDDEENVGEVPDAILGVLRRHQIPHEVILVDGGLRDKTAPIARSKGVRLLTAAAQMAVIGLLADLMDKRAAHRLDARPPRGERGAVPQATR